MFILALGEQCPRFKIGFPKEDGVYHCEESVLGISTRLSWENGAGGRGWRWVCEKEVEPGTWRLWCTCSNPRAVLPGWYDWDMYEAAGGQHSATCSFETRSN